MSLTFVFFYSGENKLLVARFRRVPGSMESPNGLVPSARSSPRNLATVPPHFLDITQVKSFGKLLSYLWVSCLKDDSIFPAFRWWWRGRPWCFLQRPVPDPRHPGYFVTTVFSFYTSSLHPKMKLRMTLPPRIVVGFLVISSKHVSDKFFQGRFLLASLQVSSSRIPSNTWVFSSTHKVHRVDLSFSWISLFLIIFRDHTLFVSMCMSFA